MTIIHHTVAYTFIGGRFDDQTVSREMNFPADERDALTAISEAVLSGDRIAMILRTEIDGQDARTRDVTEDVLRKYLTESEDASPEWIYDAIGEDAPISPEDAAYARADFLNALAAE